MRISLTGASGFLGQAIKRKSKIDGHHVISWVRNPSTTPDNDERYFNLDLAAGIDLSDTEILIHNAAYLPKSYEDPNEAVKCLLDNSISTLELLQAADKAGVQKFIYISSGTIYNPSYLTADEDCPIYPSMRATYYLTSKMVGDVFTDHFRHVSKMGIVILRPSSIYGPGMKPKGLVPRLTQKLKSDETLTAEDVGNYNVDLVHVDDVAWMAVKAAVNDFILGTFNVGGGQEVTTPQVAKTLAKILNKPEPTDISTKAESHAILDIKKAQQLGYNPVSLEGGLRSYVESL